MIAANTREVVVPAKSPHLVLVARLYHAIGARSVIGNLCTSISATKSSR